LTAFEAKYETLSRMDSRTTVLSKFGQPSEEARCDGIPKGSARFGQGDCVIALRYDRFATMYLSTANWSRHFEGHRPNRQRRGFSRTRDQDGQMRKGPDFNAPKCDCGSLERYSKEPSIPIEFDARLNEYHIRGAAGEEIMIYHCPFCGGRTPNSRRDELFMHITLSEMERLRALTQDLKTLDDVLHAFGPPDLDNPTGYGETKDDSSGRPYTTYYRQLRFTGLSDTAYVDAVVGLNNQVQIHFMPKEIAGV
jgi:hypothetical protein